MLTTRAQIVWLALLACACQSKPTSGESTSSVAPVLPARPAPPALAAASAAPVAAPVAASAPAQVGQTAPGFTLKDLDGQAVSLTEFKGKIVVLEWFNPGCPFVRASHTKGSLVDAAKRAKQAGIVWLAINSGAPGQQGHGVEANRQGKQAFALEHPVLLDLDGKVGRSYGAQRTPHLFVVDAEGKLAYAGAVDNSPDGEGEAAEGGKLVRYVDQALAELTAKKPVSVPVTKPYGCSVKYGK